jgi:hypothetical protein
MLKRTKLSTAGFALVIALAGCGNDIDAVSERSSDNSDETEKAGYTKDEFVTDFKSGFGTQDGIPEAKVECVGGEVFEALPASSLEELEDASVSSGSDMPDEAKDAIANAFADCLDIADLLAAGGDASDAEMDCLSANIAVSRADEVEFWTQTLNEEEPDGAFVDAMTQAAITCATEG